MSAIFSDPYEAELHKSECFAETMLFLEIIAAQHRYAMRYFDGKDHTFSVVTWIGMRYGDADWREFVKRRLCAAGITFVSEAERQFERTTKGIFTVYWETTFSFGPVATPAATTTVAAAAAQSK